jgi:hypothetical protein
VSLPLIKRKFILFKCVICEVAAQVHVEADLRGLKAEFYISTIFLF